MIINTIPRWQPKRRFNIIRIIEFVLCAACFGLSMYLLLNVSLGYSTFTIVAGCLVAISLCFMAICLMDICSGCTMWPSLWTYWIAVCCLATCLFALGGGLALLKKSSMKIPWAVLFIVTACVFLAELIYWICWTYKIFYKIAPGQCVLQCKGVEDPKMFNQYNSTGYDTMVYGYDGQCQCCGKPLGNCSCGPEFTPTSIPTSNLCQCCGKPLGTCTCETPVIQSIVQPPPPTTIIGPTEYCNCCGKPIGACTCESKFGSPESTLPGAVQPTTTYGATCACVEEERIRLAEEQKKREQKAKKLKAKADKQRAKLEKQRAKAEEKARKHFTKLSMTTGAMDTAGPGGGYSNVGAGCQSCIGRRSPTGEVRTMQMQTRMVETGGSNSPRMGGGCEPCNKIRSPTIEPPRCSADGTCKKSPQGSPRQGFDGPCGCCGAMYPHPGGAGQGQLGGLKMPNVVQPNIDVEQMICSGEDGKREKGEIFCGSPACMCAAKRMPNEPMQFPPGTDICKGKPGQPCMRPAFYFEDADSQTDTTPQAYRKQFI